MLEPLAVETLNVPALWDVHAFGSTTSTNEVVKAALREGAAEGFCATALEQTGGYGRQGRPWTSPVGGLYTSFALRPNKPAAELPSLSLVVSLALYHALQECGSVPDLAVKWPNDLLGGANKVCGISLEALADGVCIGIGVNAFRPQNATIAPGKYQPTYLFNEEAGECLTPSQRQQMEQLLAAMLREIEAYYTKWLQEGFAACKPEYEALLAYRNCRATMETITGGTLVEGTIRGVDDAGNLMLETPQGLIPAASGEVHITALA